VIAQGILGGITVLWFLPKPISITHAGLAQIVFCLTIAIALFTSSGWRRPKTVGHDNRRLRRLTLATTVLVYLQILVGATMRHTGAGLAIPDFPLAFGALVPPHWDPHIAIHFTHRVGAAAVAMLVIVTTTQVLARERERGELVRPAMLLLALVCVQIGLGAFVVWSGKHFVINSVHVVTGAATLGTSLVLTLRTHRSRFGLSVPVEARVAA
jgi:cytochrome c oxidase assembly protein subunit 15